MLDKTIRLNRQAVRKVAERHSQLIREAQERGDNSHQVGLDNLDAIGERISDKPIEVQTIFWDMFTEELNAITHHLEDQTGKLIADQEDMNRNAEGVGAVIGAIILFLFVAMILSA